MESRVAAAGRAAPVGRGSVAPPLHRRPATDRAGGQLLAWQASVGNRAVARLVAQRQPPAGGAVGPGGTVLTNAPAVTYSIPFDHKPLSAPGERVIFNARLTDPKPDDYQLEYSTTGGHFSSDQGPTSLIVQGLVSGNVDLLVPKPWDGKTTVQVVLKVRKIADRSLARTETWTFGLKSRIPKSMKQKEGTGERTMPANYLYELGPAVAGQKPPYYEHQTILERFASSTLGNIEPGDLKPAYLAAHKLTSAAEISAKFVNPGSGMNGTFTVDAGDGIVDQHGGTYNLGDLVANLVKPKDIEVTLPQVFEATPGTTLGKYTITRVLKADGRTWKVKKGPTP